MQEGQEVEALCLLHEAEGGGGQGRGDGADLATGRRALAPAGAADRAPHAAAHSAAHAETGAAIRARGRDRYVRMCELLNAISRLYGRRAKRDIAAGIAVRMQMNALRKNRKFCTNC